MQLRTHASNGNLFEADELLKRFLPPEKLKKGHVASDMDHTMFRADLGVQVFIERLSKPEFWKFSTERFAGLLLPKGYQQVLNDGAQKKIDELNPEHCRLALNLHHDIVNLYKLQKQLLRSNSRLDISSPVVNEFARKMIALDAIIVEMDGYLSKRFQGDLLLRTRFFAGENENHVSHLTQRVMARTADAADRVLPLSVHSANAEVADQRVTADELCDIAPDRFVEVVEDVRELFDRFTQGDSEICVVTTNIAPIAAAAIASSPYNNTVNGGVIASTLGTRMKGGHQVFQSRLSGPPVYATRKAQLAVDIAQEAGRELVAVLGDSPRNDMPMGREALKKGGVFVIVGPIEDQRRNFDPLFREGYDASSPNIGDRMWYIDLPNT